MNSEAMPHHLLSADTNQVFFFLGGGASTEQAARVNHKLFREDEDGSRHITIIIHGAFI